MTFFDTSGQPTAFLLLAAAGFAAGAAYDLASLARRKCPRWARAVPDVIWCLSAAAACALALAVTGETHLRLYALLGLCCGAGIYCLGVRALAKTVLRCIRKGPAQTREPL